MSASGPWPSHGNWIIRCQATFTQRSRLPSPNLPTGRAVDAQPSSAISRRRAWNAGLRDVQLGAQGVDGADDALEHDPLLFFGAIRAGGPTVLADADGHRGRDAGRRQGIVAEPAQQP